MAHPKGEKKFQIGEKTYTLRFDMNAIAELEEASGMTMPQIAATLQDETKIGVRLIRAILWAGLQRYHKEEVKTLEDAGELLSEADSIQELSQALGEAFAAAFQKEVERVQKKRAKSSGTGTK